MRFLRLHAQFEFISSPKNRGIRPEKGHLRPEISDRIRRWGSRQYHPPTGIGPNVDKSRSPSATFKSFNVMRLVQNNKATILAKKSPQSLLVICRHLVSN